MTSLRLKQLSHRFSRHLLFQGLDLEVRPGEWLAITGRNGSGKTTLVRILAGLARATRGTALLMEAGQPLSPEWRRKATGLVTPDLAMDAELTALENLRFHARMRDLPLGDEPALLERVGLAGRGNDRVGTFSSGMRQRLKYAFAIQHAPFLLLLDEPTANLDAAGGAIVEGIRAEQLERGILVVATNEPEEARGATYTLHLEGVVRE